MLEVLDGPQYQQREIPELLTEGWGSHSWGLFANQNRDLPKS